MGFFKDFKEDLSQAVNELSDDTSKLAFDSNKEPEDINDDVMVDTLSEKEASDALSEDYRKALSEEVTAIKTNNEEESLQSEPGQEKTVQKEKTEKEEDTVAESNDNKVSDETAIITAGLKINGNIESVGSIELLGTVEGNVTCQGKLVVSGVIKGDSKSAEFFADKAHVTGNINCSGPVKIGNGSVIIGDLYATSAVIAGAIKGNIDVHGPVILDSSAIVMGDIKSKLVQINNGAAIEGMCSQCYADNSPKKFFGDK